MNHVIDIIHVKNLNLISLSGFFVVRCLPYKHITLLQHCSNVVATLLGGCMEVVEKLYGGLVKLVTMLF